MLTNMHRTDGVAKPYCVRREAVEEEQTLWSPLSAGECHEDDWSETYTYQRPSVLVAMAYTVIPLFLTFRDTGI